MDQRSKVPKLLNNSVGGGVVGDKVEEIPMFFRGVMSVEVLSLVVVLVVVL